MKVQFLRHGQRTDAGLRLFCFPWSGATDSAYTPLADALPPDIDVVTVRPPRAACVDTAADAIAAGLPPGRFAFFGHSYGALLAFAVARRLTVPPELLVLSGSRSPATPPPVLLHQLPDDDFDTMLGQLGGMRPFALADRNFMSRFRPRVRADLATCEPYLLPKGSTVDAPISVWAGRSDWYASPWLTRGWRHYAGRSVRFHVFDGDHFFVNDTVRSASALLADLAWASPRLTLAA
ncbi:thioesterase [Lentzea tibetensis]|uniref:Thioesterase n=1 Tax=Lentzea tibetensis TaxID=2591470 RepID=A0A563ET41_9PSEU|nr:thioesterase domain-containing protein [Lentzea tibetensis]TWP50661.1 thioesterase [Lentzea tibetensis]